MNSEPQSNQIGKEKRDEHYQSSCFMVARQISTRVSAACPPTIPSCRPSHVVHLYLRFPECTADRKHPRQVPAHIVTVITDTQSHEHWTCGEKNEWALILQVAGVVPDQLLAVSWTSMMSPTRNSRPGVLDWTASRSKVNSSVPPVPAPADAGAAAGAAASASC